MHAAVTIMEEIQASGCNGAACHAQMNKMGTLLRHGSSARKQSYLLGIARGDLRLQAFAVTKPASSTDTLNLRTTARRQGDVYVINGQKIWTSHAEHSDLRVVFGRPIGQNRQQPRAVECRRARARLAGVLLKFKRAIEIRCDCR